MATLHREWVRVEQAQQWFDPDDLFWVSEEILAAAVQDLRRGNTSHWLNAIILDAVTIATGLLRRPRTPENRRSLRE